MILLLVLTLSAVIVSPGIVSTQSCAASDFAPGGAHRSDAGKPAFPIPLIEPTPLKLLLIVTDPVRGCAYGKRGGVLYRSDDRFETA